MSSNTYQADAYMSGIDKERGTRIRSPDNGPLVGSGEAMPITSIPTEIEIASDFDVIAESFFRHKHDTITDFDIVGWPMLRLVMNSTVNGSVVGDFASGTGVVADKLLKIFNPEEVILVDFSSEMLQIAQREISDPRARFLHTSVTDMNEIKDNALDLAVCAYGLDYMDVPQALEETSRVLRPGGRFVALVSHPNRNQAYWDAGGNTGAFRDGWVVEAWPGTGGKHVKKQYFHLNAWFRMIRSSPLNLEEFLEPDAPQEAEHYAKDVYDRYKQTGKRIMIFDMVNRK